MTRWLLCTYFVLHHRSYHMVSWSCSRFLECHTTLPTKKRLLISEPHSFLLCLWLLVVRWTDQSHDSKVWITQAFGRTSGCGRSQPACEHWGISGLRWLKTVASTFQDVDFDGPLPLFISWCYNGIKKTAQSLVNTLVLFSWHNRLP